MSEVSETVLDEIPSRALRLLGAINTNPYIRAAYDRRGYSDAIHDEGWTLLMRASGYGRPTPVASAASDASGVTKDKEATSALAAVDAWDEPNFRVARASLVTFPEQRDYVFDGVEAAEGVGALVSVSTFLDRLDGLRSAKERKGTRKADHAALARLAERGIDDATATRLRGWIAVAKKGVARAGDVVGEAPKNAAERREAKLALHSFFVEWSEVGRADIKRRDHLIQLGLAKRKAKKPATPAPKV